MPIHPTEPESDPARLFFIGSPGFAWHGVDKISLLARRRCDCHFDAVGLSAEQSTSLPATMTAHGQLSKDCYIHLLLGADVAVSSLALHRDGLNEASPLKTREYLAAGVPVLTAYRDTDFLRGAPFLLQLIPTLRTTCSRIWRKSMTWYNACAA